MYHPRRRWALMLLLGSLLLFPRVAFAHPEIIETLPANNAQLPEPPTVLRVVFSEPVEQTFSALQLFTAQGQRVDRGGGGRSPTEPTHLELQDVPALTPGLYTAVWQVVGSDGHLVKGYFSFTVMDLSTPAPTVVPAAGTTAVPSPTAVPSVPAVIPELELPQPAVQPPTNLNPLLRFLMLLGAIGALGGSLVLAALWPMLPMTKPDIAAIVRVRWQVTTWLFLGILLLGALNFLFVQAISMTGRALSGDTIRMLVLETLLGRALGTRLLLALLLAALVATRRPFTRWRVAAAVGLGALLLLTFSASGHAASATRPLLTIGLDWLHLAATTVWVGGLLLLVITLPAVFRALAPDVRRTLVGPLIARFSSLALLSVGVLALSGTIVALGRLTALTDLWTSTYGWALTSKLVLFAGLLALGAYNRVVIQRHITTWAERVIDAKTQTTWLRRFQWSVRSEAVLATLALGAVGMLTNSPPPQAARQGPAAAPTATATVALATATPTPTLAPPTATPTPTPPPPFVGTLTQDDLEIELRIDPARVGSNTITVTLRDQTGAPYTAQKVTAVLMLPAIDLGETRLDLGAGGAGQSSGRDLLLSIAGTWTVDIRIFRQDADDMTVRFSVPIQD